MIQMLKQTIVAALDQAIDNNIITDNVARKVKIPKRVTAETAVLSVSEQKELETGVLESKNPIAIGILLVLYSGLRMGELIGLRIEDFNFESNELTVRRSIKRVEFPLEKRTKIIVSEPKTAKGRRTIPLPMFISDLLKKHIAKRNESAIFFKELYGEDWLDEGYLFLSVDGKILDAENIRRVFNRILKKRGVKHIKFHALRHTFATRALESGFDIRSLADILGHTDVKMTLNTYAHALPEHKRGNMDKLTFISADCDKDF